MIRFAMAPVDLTFAGLGVLAGLLLWPSEALAVSFDCSKARTADQIAICSNPTASLLDDIASRGYRYLKGRYSKKEVNQLNRQILGYRRNCGSNVDCVIATQIETIKIFKKLGAPVEVPADINRIKGAAETTGNTADQSAAQPRQPSGIAPSFSCKTASLPDERAICGDSRLAELDQITTTGFKQLKAAGNRQAALAIGRKFLNVRHACGSNAGCIQRSQVAAIESYAAEGAAVRVPPWARPNTPPEAGEATVARNDSSDGRARITAFNEMMVDHYKDSEVTDLQRYDQARKSLERPDDIAITGVRISKTASGHKNTAVLIANSTYDSIDSLPGPKVDIELVAKALRYRNFNVFTFNDLGSEDLKKLFSVIDGADRSGMLLVYYAGHGAIVDGQNSLILKHFDPKNPLVGQQFISINSLLEQFKFKGFSSYFFVFDACRNFVGLSNDDKTASTVAGTDGNIRSINVSDAQVVDLTGIEYGISFSASEGQVALDSGGDGGSPYAESFARNIRTKSSILEAVLSIRKDVVDLTKGAQDPTLLLKWQTDVPLSSDRTTTLTYDFGPTYGGYVQHIRLPKEALNKLSLVSNDDKMNIEPAIATYSLDIKSSDLAVEEKENPSQYSICFSMTASQFAWDRTCVEGYLEDRLKKESLVTAAFPGVNSVSEYRIRDGVVKRDSYMELSVDLNSDGIDETMYVDSNRDGGLLSFSRVAGGQTSEINLETFLSPSFDQLLVRDFNKDGVLDIIVQQAEFFIILDGKRILEEIAKPNLEQLRVPPGAEAYMKKYFRPSGLAYCFVDPQACSDGEVLGDLAPITIFFDNGSPYYDDKSDSISYRSFDDTWSDNPQANALDDRTLYFDATQGKVVMKTAGGDRTFTPISQLR